MPKNNVTLVSDQEFMHWLSKQSGPYNYLDIETCPGARFLQAKYNDLSRTFGYDKGYDNYEDEEDLSHTRLSPKVAEALRKEPYTYEAALARIKEAMANG